MNDISTKTQINILSHETHQWDQYVLKSSTASLYHLSGWKRVVEKTFGHSTFYLYALQNTHIVGILPLVYLKSVLFGKMFVSLPYFNYGGIVAESEEIQRQLLNEAITLAQREKADHIELRHTENFDLGLPAKSSKVLMLLELPETSEELWTRFKSKLRSQIRRPEKEGFTVKFGHLDELENFYQLFAYKMRDHGTPVYTKRLFEHILTEFPENARICTVYDDKTPISTGFIIGFKTLLQIPWAASLRSYDRFGTNMWLYWNILKFGCEQGYKYFDFGRSTLDEGTYKFKKQWGSQPVQCYWHYWLAKGDDLPEVNPHNPKYQLAIRIWQKLPVSVTKLLGPPIVKFIP